MSSDAGVRAPPTEKVAPRPGDAEGEDEKKKMHNSDATLRPPPTEDDRDTSHLEGNEGDKDDEADATRSVDEVEEEEAEGEEWDLEPEAMSPPPAKRSPKKPVATPVSAPKTWGRGAITRSVPRKRRPVQEEEEERHAEVDRRLEMALKDIALRRKPRKTRAPDATPSHTPEKIPQVVTLTVGEYNRLQAREAGYRDWSSCFCEDCGRPAFNCACRCLVGIAWMVLFAALIGGIFLSGALYKLLGSWLKAW